MAKRITKINGYYLKDQELTNQLTQVSNDLPKKLILEENKLYLAKEDGTKIDTGITLPTSGSSGGQIDHNSIKDKFTTQSTETKISLCYNGSEIFSLPIEVEDDTV